ncbi:MAG TPA: hypothetical protein VGH98_17675 [Gemmatimonadaceae bacterium]|jgi:hypothetical protein
MSDEKEQQPAHVPKTSPTGVGSEATEGIHGADGDRAEAHNTGLTGKKTGRSKKDEDRSGSEPIESHDGEYRSKYGGGSREEDDSNSGKG